jgi:hypothetical protein
MVLSEESVATIAERLSRAIGKFAEALPGLMLRYLGENDGRRQQTNGWT